MARIIGLDRQLARLKDVVGPDLVSQLGAELFVAGHGVQVEAQISITTGAVSGEHHQPSKPGDPPSNDVGTLADSIETTQTGPLTVQVEATAKHAIPLEYGTSKMAARPFMEPAILRSAPDIAARVRKAIDRVERNANRKP